MQRIEQIYNYVSEALEYEKGSSLLSKITRSFIFRETLESRLQEAKGVCKDNAILLNYALQNSGIDSRPIASFGLKHVWVRVTTQDGKVFDLDPTWYKKFTLLDPRIP